jgi:hypothetical protein
MRKMMVFLLPLALVAPAAAGAKKLDAESLAKAVAPYVDDQTVAVVHVDMSRVDPEALATKIAEMTKEKREEIAKDMASFRQGVTAFRQAGGKDVFFVFSLADMPEFPFVVVPLAPGNDGQALIHFNQQAHFFPGGTAAKIGQALVVGSKRAVERLQNLKAAPHPNLAKAFAAAGDDTTAQVLLLPTSDSRRVIEQMMPALPKELGGAPSAVLTRGVQWGAAGANATPKASLRVVIQSADAGAAQKLHDLIDNVFKQAIVQISGKGPAPEVNPLAKLVPKVMGDQLTLKMDEQELVAVVLPQVQKVREAASRTQSANNLKQMALAMHNYLAVHKTFPPHASYDKNGKPLLSWRVHILPFIEEQELYKQFHLQEPWDSEHNRKLLAKMPKVYNSPLSRVGGEHKTVYLVPVAKETIFPPGPDGVRITDITDGTSNTIMIVEAADTSAVPWTKPEDLKVNAKDPMKGLVVRERNFFQAALADGSVRAIHATINPRVLWALFTRNGGEVIGDIP